LALASFNFVINAPLCFQDDKFVAPNDLLFDSPSNLAFGHPYLPYWGCFATPWASGLGGSQIFSFFAFAFVFCFWVLFIF
jgi:hypothetical protein